MLLAILAQISGPLPPVAVPVISDPDTLTNIYQQMLGQWLAVVSPYAYDLFYALAGLEMAFFGWQLWQHSRGDIQSAIMMTTNKVLMIGMFLALLMNGEQWMGWIINGFIQIGKEASGVPGLSPSALLLQGFKIFGVMLGQAVKSGAFLDLPTAIALLLAALLVCFSFLAITVQFILTKVQTFLALGMGFLFLGFGGSHWTTPYVERYFAFSVASGVKLMVLYMLAGAAWPVTQSWIAAAQAAPISQSSVESCWLIMCGALIYAAIVWFCSSTVSAILGGSPNLTHSDLLSFMGPMISAGVTAGIVASGMATGGASVAAAGGAKAAASVGAAAATPGGASAGSSSGAFAAVASLAQTGAGAAGRMPHGGQSSPPPHFNGFGH
jgi:type IV secretion system protein TrbL